jgi:hypothetical protein
MSEPIDNLGIPPLAGICSYADAARPGYSVSETVELLKRYNQVASAGVDISAAHLPNTPEWEVKCALSLHMWLWAEHAASIRKRVPEMRSPAPRMDVPADDRLGRWLDEAIRAEDTVELLVSMYGSIVPETVRAYRRHFAESNPLIDYPTFRILEQFMPDLERMRDWGVQALAALTRTPEAEARADAWQRHLDAYLVGEGEPPPARSGGTPYEMKASPRRDERFQDPFNRSAQIDEYYRDEARDPRERVLALIYKRIREMDVPEWMAPIVYKRRGKPWDYYVDMTRQLWDEARHAMMGEIALVARGIPFYKYPIDMTGSAILNEHHDPLDAHLILWLIEQFLMRADGKRYEWEMVEPELDALQKAFQDFDWADEVLHAQIGRRWLMPEAGGTREGLQEAAERAWAGAWVTLRDEYAARSQQQEWWPKLLEDLRATRSS